MKTITRVIAALMLVAMLAVVMSACGNNIKDERLYGSWKQTDPVDGNWTWTFSEDGKCSLTNDDTGAVDEGTYYIPEEGMPRVNIKLKSDNEDKTYSYTVTEKVLDLMQIDGYEFYGMKQ